MKHDHEWKELSSVDFGWFYSRKVSWCECGTCKRETVILGKKNPDYYYPEGYEDEKDTE